MTTSTPVEQDGPAAHGTARRRRVRRVLVSATLLAIAAAVALVPNGDPSGHEDPEVVAMGSTWS